MSCGECSRSVVVICSRCTQHAVPKRETSKSLSGLSVLRVYLRNETLLTLVKTLHHVQAFNNTALLCFLQANPPPVVVNTDSVDTPPYVSPGSVCTKFKPLPKTLDCTVTSQCSFQDLF